MQQKIINAIALDDEPPALELLSAYCGRIDSINLNRTFNVPGEALVYLSKYPVDLLFLDIEMPGMLGTDFRKVIDKNIMVVFTTAYSNYALEGFNLDVVDFLLKPYSFDRFSQAADKVNQYFSYLHQKTTAAVPHIFLRADYGLVKIQLNELIYIEGLEDYCKFYFDNEPPMVIRITMKSLMEKLPDNQFVRVHKSFIIRIDKCKRLRSNSLFLNNVEINIGGVYKAQVVDVFKNLGYQLSE